jgi:hypothetical protein
LRPTVAITSASVVPVTSGPSPCDQPMSVVQSLSPAVRFLAPEDERALNEHSYRDQVLLGKGSFETQWATDVLTVDHDVGQHAHRWRAGR